MKCPGVDKWTGKPCKWQRGHTRALILGGCMSEEPRFPGLRPATRDMAFVPRARKRKSPE